MRPAAARHRLRRGRRSTRCAPRLVEVAPTASATEVIHRMQSSGQALALVVKAGTVVGVVDIEDLRFAREWVGSEATVGHAMTMHVTERAGCPSRDVRPY